jgi:hypothetical protein
VVFSVETNLELAAGMFLPFFLLGDRNDEIVDYFRLLLNLLLGVGLGAACGSFVHNNCGRVLIAGVLKTVGITEGQHRQLTLLRLFASKVSDSIEGLAMGLQVAQAHFV